VHASISSAASLALAAAFGLASSISSALARKPSLKVVGLTDDLVVRVAVGVLHGELGLADAAEAGDGRGLGEGSALSGHEPNY